MKHIVALITVGLAIWASVYMAGLDAEVNKVGQIAKLIKSTAMEDSKLGGQTLKTKPVTAVVKTAQKSSNTKEMDEKLQSLKERAGNLEAFTVSPLYKKQCASCHGNVGEGIIGPKLIGRDKEYVLLNLKAFKDGSRKNYVMYGLLSRLEMEQLESLAEEIGTFQAKMDAATKK